MSGCAHDGYAELNTAQPTNPVRPNMPANKQPAATAEAASQLRRTNAENTTSIAAHIALTVAHCSKSLVTQTPRPRDLSLTRNHATRDTAACTAKAAGTSRRQDWVGGAGCSDMCVIMTQRNHAKM